MTTHGCAWNDVGIDERMGAQVHMLMQKEGNVEGGGVRLLKDLTQDFN